MKQILTTIVLLSLIATNAQAVEVALQRSGTFTFGDDVPSDWNIMLFFDSDDIQDDILETSEVQDFMITTTGGAFFDNAIYDPTDTLTQLVWNLTFDAGLPILDESIIEILNAANGQVLDYLPDMGKIVEERFSGDIPSRNGTVAEDDSTQDNAGWWSFKSLNTPAVPEPVTATLLLAGTLAMTRRRRVA